MKDSEIFPFCRKHGIKLSQSWRHSVQAVRFHNKDETKPHFMAKAQLAYRLMSMGQTVLTEVEIEYQNRREKRMRFPVCDLLWLDEKIIVEFESQITPEKIDLKNRQFKGFNVFTFNLKEVKMKDVYERLGI